MAHWGQLTLESMYWVKTGKILGSPYALKSAGDCVKSFAEPSSCKYLVVEWTLMVTKSVLTQQTSKQKLYTTVIPMSEWRL